MTIPDYDDTTLHPLISDALIEQRVADLIGRARQRQLWFLFLDDHDIQLPVLIPISDPPPRPGPTIAGLIDVIAAQFEAIEACWVVVVLERYADSTVSAGDRAWARALSESFDERRVPFRAMLISHRLGVRWLAPDDYRFGGSTR